MLLSNPTSLLSRRFGDEKAITMLAQAGFDAFDMSFCDRVSAEDPLLNEHYAEYAHQLRAFADKAGIVCNQAHAPYPSSVGDPEKDAAIYTSIVRAIESAAILGAKIIIVHPRQHLPYGANIAALKQINLDFYRSLIPYCEKFGIKVAVENMWQGNPINKRVTVDSTCSRAEEFCAYVDEIGSPWIVACLDIGHVPLTGEYEAHMIRTLGKRIAALHVHDTDAEKDLHTLPFFAKIDYEEVADLLKEVGYSGDLTFEASNFYSRVPAELVPDALTLMVKVGRYLIRRITG